MFLEADEQVGRVEVHGRYFEDMLARVLAQIRPSSRAEWLECIHQTMEAQNYLTRRCGYCPFQIAIGRDPEVPGDLLQDLPNVISSSSIHHDDVVAHTARIRSNARLAVMQFNDNLATRRALDQRPRQESFQLVTRLLCGDEALEKVHLANNGRLNGVVLASSWEQFAEIILWPCRGASVEQTPVDAPSQPTVELETASFFSALEPVSNPTQLNETTEPRAKQPRIGERVYPSPLPMPIPSTQKSQNIAETVRQVDDLVQDPEDENEEMMLVTTVAGCLLAGARREICPSSPEWSTPTGRELIAKGIKVEPDMLVHDKRALVPLSLEESALVPKQRTVPSRMVLVEKCDDDGNRFVKARLTARGDQDPELISLVRNQQTSGSMNGKVVTLQVIASLGADVELGDVTGAFLESAELNRQGGKLFLR